MLIQQGISRDGRAMTFFGNALLLASLLICTMGAVQRGYANEPDGDGSNSRTAVVIVRAAWTDRQVPLSQEILTTLMQASSVRSEAIRDVLGTGRGLIEDTGLVEVTIETLVEPDAFSADSPYLIRFALRIDEFDLESEVIPARAEELLHSMLDRMRAALVRLSEQNYANLTERVEVAHRRVKKARSDLERLLQMRRAMSQEAKRADLTRDGVVEELRWMEEQLRELEIERVSRMARRAAVEAQIAKVTDAAMSGGGGDEVLKKLEEMADTHRRRIEDLEKLKDQGAISTATIEEAKVELMEIQVRLEERRVMVAERAGAEQLPALQQELAELTIQSAEMEARFAYARERSEALRPTLELADRIENEVLIALPPARERLQEALERLNSLEAALEMYRAPQLTVVGGEGGNAK